MKFTRMLLACALVGAPAALLVPLTELAGGTYKGEQGGLYPGGQIALPPEHLAAGIALGRRIVPLDTWGRPTESGRIVLLAEGMTHLSDAELNPKLAIVESANDPREVQAAWVRFEASRSQRGWPGGTKKVEHDLTATVHRMASRFPNLKLVYLSSAIYGGYANLEPAAYETGFAVKWTIGAQLEGSPELNWNPAKGRVRAPWLAWGPYLWAGGAAGRKDGFAWMRPDFGADGAQSSATGRDKIAAEFLKFLKTDLTARPWALAAE